MYLNISWQVKGLSFISCILVYDRDDCIVFIQNNTGCTKKVKAMVWLFQNNTSQFLAEEKLDYATATLVLESEFYIHTTQHTHTYNDFLWNVQSNFIFFHPFFFVSANQLIRFNLVYRFGSRTLDTLFKDVSIFVGSFLFQIQ